ncbi:MAG: ATP-dependent metallopeptidase FtsH/Yme1/Tma family protein, partial [Acidimicrobiia bacterium]
MSRTTRTVLIYLAVIFLVVMAVSTFLNQSDAPVELTLNEFETALAEGDVDSPVEMKEKDNEITGTLNNTQEEFVLRYPGESEADLTDTILAANVDVDVINENPSLLAWFLGNVFPYLLLFGLFIFLMYQLQGGGNKVMQFGKSKAKLVTKDQPKVTFEDLAGIDEAVEELEEIKEFLEQPQKFRAMGAKIPKGVLLYGPPG